MEPPQRNSRPRYAIVGTGVRSYLYLEALLGAHAGDGELVGVCDLNPGRLRRAAGLAAERGPEVPAYAPADFQRMLRETGAERVIVTTPDFTHADYIVAALEAGVDVVTEKPLTIGADPCRRIFAARHVSGRSVRVMFNYRYSPPRTLVKQVLMSGVIGPVTAVDFEWRLDTHHGADYFRRWHRNKANSGGLLVHKATHHFDLINWWLGSTARTVRASGRRAFYRPETADAMGLAGRGERCSACAVAEACKLRLDMSRSRALTAIYAENEHHDSYFRDRCVFSPDIDIEDTMQALIAYEGGIVVNYLLNAYDAAEGYRVVFHGERGVLTLETVERAYVQGDGRLVRPALPELSTVTLQPQFSPPYRLAIPEGEGSHGGGDTVMLADLFGPGGDDSFGRAADERSGAWSALVGIAANASIASGAEVSLDDLAAGIPRPPPTRAPFGSPPTGASFDPAAYPFLAGATVIERA
ncbi:MAG TPA: Gfo/Idh/MocA family oxidoreductase [Caulobacteraceae bacterium]|jgi:predicted dehydrogenase|nr:Gfo/Idh/MocA family oxidoreductase [Caulobacteraceae bacterium]